MRQPYSPTPGSAPARLIAHLQEHGDSVNRTAIAELLQVDRKNVHNYLARAVTHGLLLRHGGGAYSLPGGEPTTDAAALQDAWGGAARPAFPSAPPRAGDPPAPAPRKMRTLKQVAQELHRGNNKPAPMTDLATIPAPEPANLRQIGGTHYKQMAVQPWDVVDGWPLEQRIGYYRGNALKYLMRMGSKDQDAQEVAKGRHYIEKLLEVLQEQDVQVPA